MSSDDDRTPPDRPPHRARTHPGDRDVHKPKHPRPDTHGHQSAVPVEINDATSQAIEDPSERAEFRNRRDTHDNSIRALARLDGQDKVLELIREDLAELKKRDTVTFTARVDVEKQHALEPLEKRRWWRNTTSKVVGGIFGGGGLAELVHWLAGHL